MVYYVAFDRMSKGCSTLGRQKSSAFDNVDQVEHVQLWRHVDRDKLSTSTLSPVCTDERQSQNFMTSDRIIMWLINIHTNCQLTLVWQSQASGQQSTFDKRATKSDLTLSTLTVLNSTWSLVGTGHQ